MNINFTPPNIPGYTFWSNYSVWSFKLNKEIEIMDIQVETSTEFDCPIEDILITDFVPTPIPERTDKTTWKFYINRAVYIRDIHKDKVENLKTYVKELLKSFKESINNE